MCVSVYISQFQKFQKAPLYVCVQEYKITVKYFESLGKHRGNLRYVGKYKKLLLLVYTSLLI